MVANRKHIKYNLQFTHKYTLIHKHTHGYIYTHTYVYVWVTCSHVNLDVKHNFSNVSCFTSFKKLSPFWIRYIRTWIKLNWLFSPGFSKTNQVQVNLLFNFDHNSGLRRPVHSQIPIKVQKEIII